MLSIVSNRQLYYPEGEYYSPDQAFPEYQHEHLSTKPNPTYRAVRACLAQAGLDKERFGSKDWNPLQGFIRAGSRVFILCNFVYHRRSRESEAAFHAKCTHGSVLRAIADYVLLATGETGRVTFGNAPIQSCDWNRVLRETGAAEVERFYKQRGLLVASCDLRSVVVEYDRLGRRLRDHISEGKTCVEVDLGMDSLLYALPRMGEERPRFRVSDYNPSNTESYHSGATHRYVVSREFLHADVVVSVPKLKTHEKVGLTCGLKGFVGIVGRKECLAHHRFGGPRIGGDEYPADSWTRLCLSGFTDWVQRDGPAARLSTGMFQILDRSIRRLLRVLGAIQFGGWQGNDTAWRMALDLARIAHYADAAGKMHEKIQRKNLLLVDGVVGGEGNGPLDPRPVYSGALVFTDDLVLGDEAACLLAGFDPAEIPIVREAFLLQKYPLTIQTMDTAPLVLNERQESIPVLAATRRAKFKRPHGWEAAAR